MPEFSSETTKSNQGKFNVKYSLPSLAPNNAQEHNTNSQDSGELGHLKKPRNIHSEKA